MKPIPLTIAIAALGLFAAAQQPQQPQRSAAAIAGPCFTSLYQTDYFTVPGLPAQYDPQDIVGISFSDFSVGFDLDYGVENLSDADVGVVGAYRYISHGIHYPGVPYWLTAPSTAALGSTSHLSPFDGVADAAEFDAMDYSSPLPAGPSGYWGGLLGSGEGGGGFNGSFGALDLHMMHLAPGGMSYWGTKRVRLEYRPFGMWWFTSGPNTGHWYSWVDRMHGSIVALGAIRYELLDGTVIELAVRP
jgi:hypothetical protein